MQQRGRVGRKPENSVTSLSSRLSHGTVGPESGPGDRVTQSRERDRCGFHRALQGGHRGTKPGCPGQAGGPRSHTGRPSGDTGTEHRAAAVRPRAQVHAARAGHAAHTHRGGPRLQPHSRRSDNAGYMLRAASCLLGGKKMFRVCKTPELPLSRLSPRRPGLGPRGRPGSRPPPRPCVSGQVPNPLGPSVLLGDMQVAPSSSSLTSPLTVCRALVADVRCDRRGADSPPPQSGRTLGGGACRHAHEVLQDRR